MKKQLLCSASRLLRHLCTAADVVAEKKDNLYRRLSGLYATGETVTKKLNDYIMEGNGVTKMELIRCIRNLRKFRKFNHALEIMEWMEKSKMHYTYADYAVRLDLIAKTEGVSAAENYFSGIPEIAKNKLTYGALLCCYCKELMVDKALDLFAEMGEMNYHSSALSFNNLLNMYLKLNQPEKAFAVVKEMKQKNISPDSFTYRMWMQSCACLNGVEGAERVLDEMKIYDEPKIDWSIYTNLAVHYVNAGLFEKAESALVEAEVIMSRRDHEAYHFLISLYAATSNLNEVNRVWDSLKKNFRVTVTKSYLVMLHALARLKDIEGLTKCYKEWESSCGSYDIRIANVLIRAYLENKMQEEAEGLFDYALKKRPSGPFFNAREMFMVFYLRNHQLNSALDHLKAMVSEVEGNTKRQLGEETVSAFIDCFEKEKDDGAVNFWKKVKDINPHDNHSYIHLLNTYIKNGN